MLPHMVAPPPVPHFTAAPGMLLAPHWPVSMDWTEEEQRALEAALHRFPLDQFDAVQRYVKIAAMLPRKSVRDVALRIKWTLHQQLVKKRKPGEAIPVVMAAAAVKKPALPPGVAMPRPPMMPAAAAMTPAQQQAYAAAAAAAAEPAPGSGVVDGPIAQLIESNFAILNEFRGNMADYKVHDNTQLLLSFRDNILAIINHMEAMGGVMSQMPQLPVRLNVDLANNFLPTRPASNPPIMSSSMLLAPPPQPALAPGMVPLGSFAPGSHSVPQPPPPSSVPPSSAPPGMIPTSQQQQQPLGAAAGGGGQLGGGAAGGYGGPQLGSYNPLQQPGNPVIMKSET